MYVIVDLEYASETLKPYSIQVTASGNDEYPWTVSLTSANAVGEPVASMVGYHPAGVWPQNFSASIGFCKTSLPEHGSNLGCALRLVGLPAETDDGIVHRSMGRAADRSRRSVDRCHLGDHDSL